MLSQDQKRCGISRAMRAPCKSGLIGLAAVALLALATSVPAQASNLVQNGSMEILSAGAANQWYIYGARLADWSLNPAPGNGGTQGVVFGPGGADTTGALFSPGYYVGLWGPGNGTMNGLPATSPDGGNYFGADDPPSYHQILSQTINGLTVGSEYQLHFYWGAAQVWVPCCGIYNGPTQNQIAVSLGAQTFTTPLESIGNHGFSGWLSQSYTYTATSTSETLGFLFASPQPSGVPPIALLDGVSLQPVPEPASLALVGTGLLGLAGFAARFKKRR